MATRECKLRQRVWAEAEPLAATTFVLSPLDKFALILVASSLSAFSWLSLALVFTLMVLAVWKHPKNYKHYHPVWRLIEMSLWQFVVVGLHSIKYMKSNKCRYHMLFIFAVRGIFNINSRKVNKPLHNTDKTCSIEVFHDY